MSTLYTVAWCSVWNHSAALHTDAGSLWHLTDTAALAGITLCGKKYPVAKGYPVGGRYCKRCVKKAYALGFPQGFTRDLPFIASRED